MPDGSDDRDSKDDEARVVDDMLSELGVDQETKRELIDSGRLKGDVFRVESADEVRRRMEISKSLERLRDSLNLVEHNLMTVEEAIERIERDIIPVVISFLVGLKGSLVNLKETIVGRSKRRAKTNLQATYVEKEVKEIVHEEFSQVESTLSSGMSEPILEKIRDVTDGLTGLLKLTYEELTTLKATIDDFTQRSATAIEFMQKALTMKPRVEVPKEVEEKLRGMERQVEELQRELNVSTQKLENREAQVTALQEQLAVSKAQNEEFESTIASLRAAPTVDASQAAELRQQIKGLEASKDLLEEKLREANASEETAIARIKELQEEIAKRDLSIEDVRAQVRRLEEEIEKGKERLTEVDDLRARIRSYESGDHAREAARVKSELERISAQHERLVRDHEALTEKLEATQATLTGYLDLMKSTDKTKAFLTIEDVGEMSIRELARYLGVSPAIATKWAEDFEALGIARIVDGTTIVVDRKLPKDDASV